MSVKRGQPPDFVNPDKADSEFAVNCSSRTRLATYILAINGSDVVIHAVVEVDYKIKFSDLGHLVQATLTCE